MVSESSVLVSNFSLFPPRRPVMSVAPSVGPGIPQTSFSSTTNANETNSSNALPIIELPGYFEDVALDDLVLLIADLLQRMIVHNDQIPLSAEGLTRFHSRSTPGISVLDYLRRIVRYVRVERSVLLLILHSIDQICARRPSFNISSLSVHRFLIAAITILSKTFCDAFSPNPLFAKVGGVSLIELNLLEREFLSVMDWRLACTREVLHAYYVKLVRTHSSGRYAVPDTSPRPAPIDTLPSDQIDWSYPWTSTEASKSTDRVSAAVSHPHRPSSQSSAQRASTAMDETSDGGSSSESEVEISPVMATDMKPRPRRIPSNGGSQTNSPLGKFSGPKRGAAQPSTSATLEQNMAFMEMTTTTIEPKQPTLTTQDSNIASSINGGSSRSALNRPRASPTSPSSPQARSPTNVFRSPVVGPRRRRRSSAEEPVTLRVPNALLRPDVVVDPGAVEGLLRGSSRRRLHHEPQTSERDLRMEVEPGTPRSSA